jgi:hypothetical protein
MRPFFAHLFAARSLPIAIVLCGAAMGVRVTAAQSELQRPVSFQFDVLPVLSRQGCSGGACHGSPSGKGGFRLSLRGFDATVDRLTLIKEDMGRRANLLNPDDSLLLQKPLMKLPHGGGRRLTQNDSSFRILRRWIAEGCRLDPPDGPLLADIEIGPSNSLLLTTPDSAQQLSVQAHFSDGTARDITNLACYSSSDARVADVTATGLIVRSGRGETTVLVRYLEQTRSCAVTATTNFQAFAWTAPPAANYIDEHVHAKLRQLKYLPAATAPDEVFLRRVYLDVVGQLPTGTETEAFLAEDAADKRARLIDDLLKRPDHARFWAHRWGELLRITAARLGKRGAIAYHKWVERAFAENLPYDQFARELLSASGSTLENPAANFFCTSVDALDTVEAVAQVFLGARVQCAKCHNHPFESWTQDNYFGLVTFFNRVERKQLPEEGSEIVLGEKGEVRQPRTGKPIKPWLPNHGQIDFSQTKDRRQLFIDWLTSKANPWFAKVEVNRIWALVMGRGIVHPPDDFRDSNPPSNGPLLEALAADFSQHGFDRRHLLRTILNSRTYQADFATNEFNHDDTKYGSHYSTRLLSAEQLLDAISAFTDVPEPFSGLAETKATQLPAPDIAKHEFLKSFGLPERQAVCTCERAADSNLGMVVQLLNGPLVHRKLTDSDNRFRKLLAAGKPKDEIVSELYRAAVCRRPSESELKAALAHLAAKSDEVAALEDVAWAILNTNEFLFQH